MNKNRILYLITSVASTIMLTACGATMKPDHPQVFDNFKERRPPKENVFVESGTIDSQQQTRASNFTPYSGPVNEGPNSSKNQVIEAVTPDNTLAKEPAQLGGARMQVIAPDGTAPTVPSQEQRNMWERLKDKFSAAPGYSKSENLAMRRSPSQNHMMIASISVTPTAQGSADGYSHYESADEIVQAVQIEETVAQNIMLAANNPSEPLVNITQPKSYVDLKQEGENLGEQNLKDVSQRSLSDSSEETFIKAEPVIKKSVHKSNKVKTIRDSIDDMTVDTNDYIIQDKKAEIVYQNGKPILTGSIGVIRKEIK